MQFAAIPPLLDGKGGAGQLLIVLLLCEEGVPNEPLLYLSLYLKAHRQRCYDLLQKARLEGDWEAWLEFFLADVRETAASAAGTAKRLADMFNAHQRAIQEATQAAGSAVRVLLALPKKPIAKVGKLAQAAGVSVSTVTKALAKLEQMGIVVKITGGKYARTYCYEPYINFLNEGV